MLYFVKEGRNMPENRNKEEKTSYSPRDKKWIRIHWLILSLLIFFVMAFSAMRSLIDYYPLVGYPVALGLSVLMAYYLSFMVYRWTNEKGWWIYILIVFVLILMMARY